MLIASECVIHAYRDATRFAIDGRVIEVGVVFTVEQVADVRLHRQLFRQLILCEQIDERIAALVEALRFAVRTGDIFVHLILLVNPAAYGQFRKHRDAVAAEQLQLRLRREAVKATI